jgi:hypothetical protein
MPTGRFFGSPRTSGTLSSAGCETENSTVLAGSDRASSQRLREAEGHSESRGPSAFLLFQPVAISPDSSASGYEPDISRNGPHNPTAGYSAGPVIAPGTGPTARRLVVIPLVGGPFVAVIGNHVAGHVGSAGERGLLTRMPRQPHGSRHPRPAAPDPRQHPPGNSIYGPPMPPQQQRRDIDAVCPGASPGAAAIVEYVCLGRFPCWRSAGSSDLVQNPSADRCLSLQVAAAFLLQHLLGAPGYSRRATSVRRNRDEHDGADPSD